MVVVPKGPDGLAEGYAPASGVGLLALPLALTSLCSLVAHPQDYPSRPVAPMLYGMWEDLHKSPKDCWLPLAPSADSALHPDYSC